MNLSLFVTGSTGFIGSRLIQKLDPTIYDPIYCLSRSDVPVSVPSAEYGPFRWVTGNICEPDSYASILESCDTVIHLAATTGTTSPCLRSLHGNAGWPGGPSSYAGPAPA